MQEELKAMETFIDAVIDFFVNYSFQVIGAIIILVAGIIAARMIASFLLKLFDKKHLDITLSKFVASTAKGIIIAFAIIIALGKFGITIAPFIAALAATAFGASFAIQVIQATLGDFKEIVKIPSPQVGIQEFADSSIKIGFRYWIPSRKYFEALYAVNLAVFYRFNENGTDIPFPQRVVHMQGKTS